MGAVDFFVSLVKVDHVIGGRMNGERPHDFGNRGQLPPVFLNTFSRVRGGGTTLRARFKSIFHLGVFSGPLFLGLGRDGRLLLLKLGVQILLPVNAQVNRMGNMFKRAQDIDVYFYTLWIGANQTGSVFWAPLQHKVFRLAPSLLTNLTNDLYH